MAEDKNLVTLATEKATPVAPAEPTPGVAITGATFAERAAARDSKSVTADEDGTEDKSVSASRATSKSRTTRK